MIELALGIIIGLLINPMKEKYLDVKENVKDLFSKDNKTSFIEPKDEN